MKVIVAIDQSSYWKQLIESVHDRDWPEDTTFRILTVLAPLEWEDFDPCPLHDVLKEIVEKRQKQAEEILRQARKLLTKNHPDYSVHTELRHGSPRNEIVDSAAEWKADKIMLGAHGHSPNRLFPGAIPRLVAQHAHCSVELIRLKPLYKGSDADRQRHMTKAGAR